MDKYSISYYIDFLKNLKEEYNSSNDITETFNIGIKHYIDQIEENGITMNDNQWKDLERVALSNTDDAKYLAIYMIESQMCPISIVRDFEDKTTDEDILISCLSRELDEKRIAYLINSIDASKITRIARTCEMREEEFPPFTQKAIETMVSDYSEKFEDRLILFLHSQKAIEELEKKNGGLTERQSTYVLMNPYVNDSFKYRIYNEYGYDLEKLNQYVPISSVCNDIFNSAYQALFEFPDIDDNTKKSAENIIKKLQSKELLSELAQSKLVRMHNQGKMNTQSLSEIIKNIALTTKSGIVFGLMQHPLKYRNPIATPSSLSIALLEGLETMSNCLTDSTYRETANFVFNKVVYQNKVSDENLKHLYEFIKTERKQRKDLLNEPMLSIVCNIEISQQWRDKFAKLYKKNEELHIFNKLTTQLKEKEFSNEEIKYILECMLRKNTYIQKREDERHPDVYIYDEKIKTLENIIKNTTSELPEVMLKIRRGLSVISFERYYERLYRENYRLFAPQADYDLYSSKENAKTIHIFKLDRMTDETLKEMYAKLSFDELKIMKNQIYSAVSYQPHKQNLYAWLDKYVRQYNIVCDMIKERENIKEQEKAKVLEETEVR